MPVIVGAEDKNTTSFLTYHSKVLESLPPTIRRQLGVVFTHKGALTVDFLDRVTQSARCSPDRCIHLLRSVRSDRLRHHILDICTTASELSEIHMPVHTAFFV